ncbi:MAG: CehA/McbA family metallohydrolase [Planctomycetes bacterium]|nr:CehA/McbA family metallohydrolase [Planctomycetota bacterium]
MLLSAESTGRLGALLTMIVVLGCLAIFSSSARALDKSVETYPDLADRLEAQRQQRIREKAQNRKKPATNTKAEAKPAKETPLEPPELDDRLNPLPTEEKKKEPKPDENATGVVNISILDENGPVAGRVIIKDIKGKTYGALPGLKGAWIDGSQAFRLPVGVYNVDVTCGKHRLPWGGVIKSEKDAETRTIVQTGSYGLDTIKGWRQFDPYVNTNTKSEMSNLYSFRTLGEFGIAARAEGIEVVGVDGAWGMFDSRGVIFSESRTDKRDLSLAFAQETRDRYLPLFSWTESGEGNLYALSTSPVLPVKNKGREHFETYAAVRDRGGIAILSNPGGKVIKLSSGVAGGVAGHLLFDVNAGIMPDAFDVSGGGFNLDLWYFMLNLGYRITALAGGPDARGDEAMDIPSLSSYLYLPENKLTPAKTLDAIREGRVIVSNGPFIDFSIDGCKPGGVTHPSRDPKAVFVNVLSGIERTDSIAEVELVYNGKVVKKWKGGKLQKSLAMRHVQAFTDVGWAIARYRSMNSDYWAFTNPIYFTTNGYTPPEPIMARINISLHDALAGKALAGTVKVYNLGVCIETIEVGAEGGTIEVPPTARLVVACEGYDNLDFNVYADGGARAMLDSLAKENKLRPALLNEAAYGKMRELLRNIEFKAGMVRAARK